MWVPVVADRRLSVHLRQPGPIPLDIEFVCDSGDVLAIFGPSGSGKTTILRTIAGLYRPATASVRSGPETWTDTVTETFAPPHRRAVGFVFQEYALFPHMSVRENVAFAGKARADELLVRFRIAHLARARPAQLSGGERQRVGLARALGADADVLLMDEPFGALDALTRFDLHEEFRRIQSTLRKTVLLVTHDLREAAFLADRVAVMSARPGRIKCDLKVDIAHPRHYSVKTTPVFMELKARLTEEIRIEVQRAAGLIPAAA